ncbi:dienelactone hydrolase family protein [Pedobacter sp. MC2016-14]|uniref:carboxylesterase family protein n=1 Tax=Pedobacter sp. MC2016-14 TaxID=2897327 RepID=UPI001E619B8A|nr:dienelactone hydrolase family protein [Pedobacter sp. MC2016-14]MCD0486623.1 dienelactone hydrolase family protein [Pedobacter sp. MC2016-14]
MKLFRGIFLLLLLSALTAHAQDFKKYDKGSYINGEDSIFYRILFPEHFNPQQKYPVVFVLHGAGERGKDNEKQLLHGGPLFLKPENRKQFPAIVIFPQCPAESFWANVQIKQDSTGKRGFSFLTGGKPTKAMHALLGMIDNILDKPYIDKHQVYVGGLSMGAMGTYELLRRKPKTFAASFAICGGDNITNVNKYKKVPLWIFHGGKDAIVPPAFSKEIADQLKIIGKEVKYTFYPEADHNSWDSAFAEPQFLSWLFVHKK